MINLKNICKSYGNTQVLSNFSLSLGKGEKTALMGLSGSGKTTLLNIIMGIEKPDSGEVLISKGARISCVFQENRLVEELTAKKNILLCCRLKQIDALAAEIGISADELNKPVAQLSGGQKRRIAVLRAVLAKSDVLIFDEALQGMDKETEAQVAQFVNKHLNGRALLAVTHSQSEAQSYGAKIISLA